MRDEFAPAVKDLLAKRVAYRCSNPGCRQVTSGPQEDPSKTINIGVAAHITAASTDGPRFDPSLTTDQRRSVENGIWLCQTCGKLVDNDEDFYDVSLLRDWKNLAEKMAAKALQHRRSAGTDANEAFQDIEGLMPQLLAEMRQDLAKIPTSREFVILSKRWVYNSRGNELYYFYEDHPDLENKVHILENYGLVRDITYNNTKRYVITEKLAKYLILS